MKKTPFAVTLSLITALALSGCYPTGKKVNQDISSTASESTHFDGSHFEYSKDNLTVSFDITEIPSELPSRIKLKEKIFDRQKLIELVFDGEAPVSEHLYGVNEEYGRYTARDGSELIIEGNRISYYNAKISHEDDPNFPGSYSSVINVCKKHMRDMYSITENELEEFPLQTALKTANDLISELGITGFGEPEIYAVSLTSYEKIYSDDARIVNKNYPLTKDNEIYVFRFPQTIDEVKLSDINVDIKDHTREWATLATPSSFVVGISKEGIFEFYIDAAYETDVEILSSEPIKYDFNHAIIELEKYFDKVNFTRSKTVTINNAGVIYYPVERNEVDTMEFVPAWSFGGYSRDLVFEEKIGYAAIWDFRFIVNTDVGVVREYSEV